MESNQPKTEGLAAVASGDLLGILSVRTVGKAKSGWEGFEMREVEIQLGDLKLSGPIRYANDAGELDVAWAKNAIIQSLRESGWLVLPNTKVSDGANNQ